MSKKLLVAAGLLLAALILLLAALRREPRAPSLAAAAAPTSPSPSPAPMAPPAAVATTIDAAMPAGLAEDLAMFNSDQLRAELESIALSYPAVVVLSVACDSRPCTAELQVEHEGDDEVRSLNAFLDLVSKRFQGFVVASFRQLVLPGGARAVRALLIVGGGTPHPAPRFP